MNRRLYLTGSAALQLILLLVLIACKPSGSPKDEPAEAVAAPEPLPSWQEPVAEEIMNYVQAVTDSSSADFIPVKERIATFDNDGTLWSEQTLYFQLLFVFDRIKEMAPQHPEWRETQPYQAVLEGDMETLMSFGVEGLLELAMATHAGMTTEEFDRSVSAWIDTAKHPQKNVLFTELIYQPMQELIDYLEDHDFKVFIVSGGGIDFMRVWVEDIYGLPKDQVVGTSIKKEYDYNEGQPVIRRLAEMDLIDDKGGKPVGIDRYIGRKPVLSAGNSDGDLQMMRWTDANAHKTLKLYLHHTDADREWAYDRKSHIGRFDAALDEAQQKGWLIVDMKKDWRQVYP